MRIRTFASTGAAAALLLSLLAAPPAAQAEEFTCHVTASMPGEFVLKPKVSGHLTFYVQLTATPAGCYDVSDEFPYNFKRDGSDRNPDVSYLGEGVWKIDHAIGLVDGSAAIVTLVGTSSQKVYYGGDNWISDDSAPMNVRNQGYASTKVEVHGKTRTVTGRATHFSYRGYEDGVEPWERTILQIQQLKQGQWVTIKSGRTNAAGKLVATVRSGKASFRSVIVPAADAVATGATSKIVRR